MRAEETVTGFEHGPSAMRKGNFANPICLKDFLAYSSKGCLVTWGYKDIERRSQNKVISWKIGFTSLRSGNHWVEGSSDSTRKAAFS